MGLVQMRGVVFKRECLVQKRLSKRRDCGEQRKCALKWGTGRLYSCVPGEHGRFK